MTTDEHGCQARQNYYSEGLSLETLFRSCQCYERADDQSRKTDEKVDAGLTALFVFP